MKNVLVIGMGRFGRAFAKKMLELKNDVMIVDKDEELINELAPYFTDAHAGDCTNEAVLRALGVDNFDICFVTIGENFQSSIIISALLKDFGAKKVVSKANFELQAKFLLRNGADEVVFPECEYAERLAIRHSANNIFDYIEVSPEFGIFEIPILQSWVGKNLGELDLRRKFKINVIAIKNESSLSTLPEPDYRFRPDDHVVIIGKAADIYKLANKI